MAPLVSVSFLIYIAAASKVFALNFPSRAFTLIGVASSVTAPVEIIGHTKRSAARNSRLTLRERQVVAGEPAAAARAVICTPVARISLSPRHRGQKDEGRNP